jgi:hypothetical protein
MNRSSLLSQDNLGPFDLKSPPLQEETSNSLIKNKNIKICDVEAESGESLQRAKLKQI